jgi:hypothetical protein
MKTAADVVKALKAGGNRPTVLGPITFDKKAT